ncbi:carboxy terminal-processing peptidase [Salinisphaera sp. Q1T1-3]|uniref:carboxy terminal-processing peptidase n=1 Tax=Salinisphaera sp. Q1T1-3 TaxID=2321229 RepID=UPI000E73696D|nr:carboxy terminal-processing peptidase [Salinisphaera sp. Q1T1-3]RJS94180.1 peptidase [Salinisphaera sp. Q1T1-3]
MRKIALTVTLVAALFTQTGCAASDTDKMPQPVPDAGAGPAKGYTPLVPDNNEGKIDKEIVRELQENHYNKVGLDDAFSTQFFKAYLDDLDGTHSVFLASDIQRLKKKYGDSLDDQLRNGHLNAAFDIFNTYQKRRIQIDQWALARIGQGLDTLDLNNDESFNVDREDAPWPADAAAREKLWRKQLENQVIDLRLSDVAPDEIQKRLTQRYTNELKQLRQAEPTDAFSVYMDAYTHSYDPHTDYFSPRRAEDFSIDMNLSLQGIGAELRSKNGYAELVRLIPGGPAAKSGKLKPTDRIIAVGQGKSGDFTDVIGMRLDETVQLIRGKKDSYVRLQVQPADSGQTKTVTLQRDKIKLKDQAASSKIIHVKQDGKSHKIGLLTLPSFYNGTSDDVKKQLVKLKKDNVDGVVLDLRNNGGGALGEAMQLIGLFMDSAPGVQIRDANGNIQVLGDRNNGAVYSGPLAVMTNRLSASASEIVAGALQDYGRAIILGSRTFGKGTVQTLLPLSEGQLKLTEAKFYRVSGKSTQDRGVKPDIDFASAIDPDKIGESALPNALPYDTIPPTAYPTSDAINGVLNTLRQEHNARVAHEPDFQYLVKRIQAAREESNKTTVSLNIDTRRAEQNKLQQQMLSLANTHRKATGKPPYENYKAFEDAQDAEQSGNDDEGDDSETLPDQTPGMSNTDKIDAYQTESAHILLDMIHAIVAKQDQQGND